MKSPPGTIRHNPQPIRDYRRVVSGSVSPISPQLHTELRRTEMQREVFLELSDLSPDSVVETEPLPELSMSTPPEEAGRPLREYTGIGLQEQRSWRDPGEALNGWVNAVERKGVLVVHATRVPIEEMRGFSISSMPFTVVGLNGADWPRPRIFTLFHELAHIALNVGGVRDLHESEQHSEEESDRIEHFGNAAAAAAIVPAVELLSSEDIYDEARSDQKLRGKGSAGGPSYYVVKARDIGHGYAHSVLDA